MQMSANAPAQVKVVAAAPCPRAHKVAPNHRKRVFGAVRFRCGRRPHRPKPSAPTSPVHRFAPAAPNEAYRFAPVCTGSERSCSDVRTSVYGAVRFRCGRRPHRLKPGAPTTPEHWFAPTAPNEEHRFAPVCTASENGAQAAGTSHGCDPNSVAPSVHRLTGAHRTAPHRPVAGDLISVRQQNSVRFGAGA